MNNVMEFLSLFNILVCGIRFFCARRREMQTPMSGTVYTYIYIYTVADMGVRVSRRRGDCCAKKPYPTH